MSGIGPISDYDYWKLRSPYEEREEFEEQTEGCEFCGHWPCRCEEDSDAD